MVAGYAHGSCVLMIRAGEAWNPLTQGENKITTHPCHSSVHWNYDKL
jgi:hypothetical protein